MISRFKKLLEELRLSPSEFADRIGVQRSSISHILGGRNKPSIDFLEKILNTFPEVDARWLITGKGNWKEPSFDKADRPAMDVSRPAEAAEIRPEAEPETWPDRQIKIPALKESGPVDHIIIVYKDNTFRLLRPRD